MPYLTINEVGLFSQKPDGSYSVSGHMWYQLTDDHGATFSYGFGPKGGPEAWGPGEVNRIDSSYYSDRSYSRQVWISQDRYDAMKAFGEATANASSNSWVSVKGVVMDSIIPFKCITMAYLIVALITHGWQWRLADLIREME